MVVLGKDLDLSELRDLNWVYPQPVQDPFTAVWSVDPRAVSWTALKEEGLLTGLMMCVTRAPLNERREGRRKRCTFPRT